MTVVFLICATVTSACAQEKPKRMIPGSSVKELVPESPNEKEDGVAQITLGQLFKPGSTEYTHVGANALKDAPPLPTGYVLFKDLVYRIKTEAVTSSSQLIVFNLPSAENEIDFSKLSILHLEDDEMSPSGSSWAEVTVLRGGWDEHFHFVTKAQYDALQPDFKSKRIAAITGQFGLFAIALAPESEPKRTEPFPEVTLKATSSPEPVPVGEEVTHTITVANKGSSAAAEVNVKEVLDIYLEYVSATPSQGVCKQKTAGNNIVCHLGALPGGASVTITVVSRTRPATVTKDTIEASNTIEAVFKQSATDFVDERGQIEMQRLPSTIVKKH
ncbi:MAG: hypothetical protein QOH41_763 [Blastocatellia bacterium]|nr:hypothetical protein [Blastocatellia bacterium]